MIPKTTRGRVAILVLAGFLAAIPLSALLGFAAPASEVTQLLVLIEDALTAVETAATVFELEDQIEQQLDDAMGRIGSLTQAFEDLSSDPMSLLENAQGLSWAGDFSGEPLALVNAFADMQDDGGNSLLTHSRQTLAAADTVSRDRYARAFRYNTNASDNWIERRERAERQLAADYLVLDSAEAVIELLGKTSESVERSRQQTELADTALAQEAHAMKLNDIEVDIAVAQLTAHHAARNMLETWKLEREHREQLQEWMDALNRERQQARRAQNRARARGGAMSRALLLN